MQLFDLLWSGLGLKLSQHLHFEWAPGIEGPALGRAEANHGKPGFVLAGPAGAFGGVRGVTPHQASGKTDLV